MPITEAQKRAVKKYNESHYKRISLQYPFAFYEQIKAEAERSGETVSQYIRNAIQQRFDRERQNK